jgi:hypothetical protein
VVVATGRAGPAQRDHGDQQRHHRSAAGGQRLRKAARDLRLTIDTITVLVSIIEAQGRQVRVWAITTRASRSSPRSLRSDKSSRDQPAWHRRAARSRASRHSLTSSAPSAIPSVTFGV